MSADILNYTLNALGFKSSDPVSDKARELFRTVQQNGNNKSFFHVVVIEAACKILRVTNYNKSKLRSHANMTTDKYLKCLYLLKNIHKWQWESHVSIEALDTRFGDNKLASITYSILGMFISKLPASQQASDVLNKKITMFQVCAFLDAAKQQKLNLAGFESAVLEFADIIPSEFRDIKIQFTNLLSCRSKLDPSGTVQRDSYASRAKVVPNIGPKTSLDTQNSKNITNINLNNYNQDNEASISRSEPMKKSIVQQHNPHSRITTNDKNNLEYDTTEAAISATVGSRRAEAMIGGAEVLRQNLSKDTAMMELEVKRKRKNREIYSEWKSRVIQKYRKLEANNI